MLANNRVVDALALKSTDRTPVWLMRQAGRYLPQYRATRAKAGNFLNLCRNPQLCCEVAMQPIEQFQLDAAILFSDILTIPDAMGFGLYFVQGEGPKFAHKVEDKVLTSINTARDLPYVLEAIKLTKRALDNSVPLLGFCGSPWTLATYILEGGGSRNFEQTMGLRYRDPQKLHRVLEVLTENVTEHLSAQIEAGVDAVQIFDTWGGVLDNRGYLEFSLYYMRKIVQDLRSRYPNTPTILFTKAGSPWLTQLADSGCNGIGVDWTIDLEQVRKVCAGKVAIQGNLHPQVLCTDEPTVRREVERVIDNYGRHSGHIFNLGHGITPDAKPELVRFLTQYVAEYSFEIFSQSGANGRD